MTVRTLKKFKVGNLAAGCANIDDPKMVREMCEHANVDHSVFDSKVGGSQRFLIFEDLTQPEAEVLVSLLISPSAMDVTGVASDTRSAQNALRKVLAAFESAFGEPSERAAFCRGILR